MRGRILSACAALWGLAIAIALHPIWMTAAPPGQLPGFATANGFNGHAPLEFILGLILLPIVVSAALRPVIARLTAPEARTWAGDVAAVAMVVPLWAVVLSRNVGWTIIPTAIVVLAAFLLRFRDARFSRRDVILLPVLAPVLLAMMSLTDLGIEHQLVASCLMVLTIRLLVAAIPRRSAPALAFTLSPLAIVLQSHVLSYDQRHLGWPPLLFALGTPLLIRAFVPDTPLMRRRLRQLTVWLVFPVAACGYVSATSLLSAEGKPHISMFEDAHHLVPASEVLRGEKFYRDIIPAHGLIQDGGQDVVLFRTGPVTAGRALKGGNAIRGINAAVVYGLAALATGSPEAGVLAFALSASTGVAAGSTRVLPSLIALAFAVGAVRRRRPRGLFWSGVFVILSGLTSIDFGIYGILMLLFAATRVRRGWRYAAAGLGVAAAMASLILIASGIFIPFLRTSFLEVAALGPVYTLNPFQPPATFTTTFRFLPEVLAGVFQLDSVFYLGWIAALLILVLALTTRPPVQGRRRAQFDALATIAAWIVVVAVSYGERHHLHFQGAVPPLFVAVAAYTASRNRWLMGAAVLILTMIAQPTMHLAITGWVRHSRGPMSERLVDMEDPPRARGVFFDRDEVATIQAAGRYIGHLAPGETWFDFTNRGLLYFLFDRDCPIRAVEVAFYEKEAQQREVIAAIERNPRVVAALVPAQLGECAVDNVPNATRAPLVWSYLQEHFRPEYQEGSVVFWRRK